MSELRSVVEALRSESLSWLPDARLQEDFTELHRAVEQLEAERLRRLAEIDRRRLYGRDGYLSCASWLVAQLRVGFGRAREAVRVARALDEMPVVRHALDEGDISLSAVRMLAGVREVDRAAFTRDEAALVEAARIHSLKDLQRVAAHWRALAEQEQVPDPEARMRRRRSLHASVSYLGMVRVDGTLDPETGETLLTALGAVLDADAHSGTPDSRSAAQRRADALGEICRQWLDRSDRPTVGGERPHVSVTVGLDVLKGARGTAEPDHAGPVSASVAERLACDASVTRVVLSAASEPLDVGRRTPVVSVAMRRALVIRDRHCRFPGCDRPPAFCDAHHVVHWAKGGPTSMANLILLCRRHHRLIHDHGGFTLELVRGRPVFGRADGSVLQERGPP